MQGDGQGLRKTTDVINTTTGGLRVQPNQTLAIVGGDVALLGGTLKTAGGRIELGSVAGSGLVNLTPIDSGWVLGYEGVRLWQRLGKSYLPLSDRVFEAFQKTYFPGERAPQVGESWRNPDQAQTLREIAATEGESFYHGRLAEKIATYAANTNGLLTLADLKSHTVDWVQPISTDYRGYHIWQIPPNTQGIATLMALNILEGFDLHTFPRESIDSYHLQIEAMKLAIADLQQHVADPKFMEVSLPQLLDKTYASDRRCLIQDHAMPSATSGLSKGDTVYLAVADGELMVSLIQSNYLTFGSGILVPGTGITLHSRGACFDLNPQHPNCAAPEKRSFHTIMPGFLSRDGQPISAFGVMGDICSPKDSCRCCSI